MLQCRAKILPQEEPKSAGKVATDASVPLQRSLHSAHQGVTNPSGTTLLSLQCHPPFLPPLPLEEEEGAKIIRFQPRYLHCSHQQDIHVCCFVRSYAQRRRVEVVCVSGVGVGLPFPPDSGSTKTSHATSNCTYSYVVEPTAQRVGQIGLDERVRTYAVTSSTAECILPLPLPAY